MRSVSVVRLVVAVMALLGPALAAAADATPPLISGDVFWTNCAGALAADTPEYAFCTAYITGLTDGYIASMMLVGQPGPCLHASDMDSFVRSVIAAMPVSENGRLPIAPEALTAIRGLMKCE